MNEQDAIARCVQGDMSAFGVLYDLYIEKIYRFIYYRTHHKQTAEDLTSVVFTKAFSKFSSFDPSAPFAAWLFRIARNAVIDNHRTHKLTSDLAEAFDVSDDTNIEADYQTKEQLRKVWEYLKLLTPDQRDLITMRLWDGLSYSEIASVTGKSEATLRVNFSRLIVKMQKEIIIALILLGILTLK